MKKKKIRRVDVQVSIFTAILVTISILVLFLLNYSLTYQDMIRSLTDRVFSIYTYAEREMDNASFNDLNTAEDQEKEVYLQTKQMLKNVKQATGVRYLYTAKKDDQGNFIYLVDGLDAVAEDFRHVGDPIEPEIVSDMQRALDGEIVLPKDIKNTTWGKIFITYFPIRSGDSVVGVLGIEFGADHQYDTYRTLRIATPLVAVFVCLISMVLAVAFFKRISNPTYQDMANTDQLTQLKNRNAYDIDMKNIAVRREGKGLGVIAMDLNNLKLVNDTLGHNEGDEYIRCAAAALRRAAGKKGVSYRIGGDEFVLVLGASSEEKMQAVAKIINAFFEQSKPDYPIPLAVATGYALFDSKLDPDFHAVCRRADLAMYEDKKRFHAAQGNGFSD